MTLWQKEFQEAFKRSEDLSSFLDYPVPHTSYPLLIPKKLAKKIKEKGPNHPLWKQFIPCSKEEVFQGGSLDPIGDMANFKGGQIIHRYKNRCLFLPINRCPVVCRFCFRKNELFSGGELFEVSFAETLNYLNSHSEIHEIIFSGGDPFLLSDEKIREFLHSFSKIPHIHYIRFHTRFFTTIPSRATADLLKILKNFSSHFSKIHIVLHINHISELEDEEIQESIQKLQKTEAILLSQTAFLKEVNDNFIELKNLIEKLIRLNIRPYYLHHFDYVKGAESFSISEEEGKIIYQKLRNSLPGWALPTYVKESPNGEGKTSFF